jgi:hypothetical protein
LLDTFESRIDAVEPVTDRAEMFQNEVFQDSAMA